jgi:hypothetical protein
MQLSIAEVAPQVFLGTDTLLASPPAPVCLYVGIHLFQVPADDAPTAARPAGRHCLACLRSDNFFDALCRFRGRNGVLDRGTPVDPIHARYE